MHFVNFRLRSCFWGQWMGRPVSWRGPLHGGKSPGYLAEKINHECGWHRDRDEGFDGLFPAGKRHGVFRGSTACQKKRYFHNVGSKLILNYVPPGRVPGGTYFTGCKCGICPPSGDKLCAQQTAKTCRKAPKGFFDSLSSPPPEGCSYMGSNPFRITQKRPTTFVVGLFWQRMRDSNPRERSQSPVCYRYTNPL